MFYFHPSVLLRIPYFPYTKYKSQSLQESMDTQAVKNAQLLAAPTFFNILKKNGFKEDTLNPKQKQTIENYLNRMHYRCTPFGLFAGTMPLRWMDMEPSAIIVGNKRIVQTLPSFNVETSALQELRKIERPIADARYFSNPAHMLVGNEMRYLGVSQASSKESIREYVLKSIAVDKSLKQFWAFCATPLPPADIITYLAQLYDMAITESTAFFQNLLEEQILLSDIEPNITGVCYSERLSMFANKESVTDPLALSQALTSTLNATTPFPDAYETYVEDQIKSNCYVHLSMHAGEQYQGVSHQYQQKILDGFHAVQKLLPLSESSELDIFKTAFIEKFDQRCVSLLEALDPELGINYAGLSCGQNQSEILEHLDRKDTKTLQKDIKWSAVHTLLLQQWQSSKNSKAPILLNEKDLEKLPVSKQPLPPSISTIFKIHNDHVVLEHIGGATANAILGRFSIFHKEVEACCKDTARTEAILNPEVLFAEITSVQDLHAANIEKRKHFYDYEIPILTTSLLPDDHQIQLNDLYVMVRQNRIILFSRKLKKEVIPRLSSAFNYRRSSLSVYRFLCDLQFQGIRKMMPFSMQRLFPELPFYPRVVYNKSILQLATWHIKKEAIQRLLDEQPAAQKVLHMRAYLQALDLPDYFSLKEHDNQLVFNINDDKDLLLFCQNIKNLSAITLEEFPFIDKDPLLRDENNEGYQHQFVATLMNASNVYAGSQSLIQQALPVLQGGNISFMPGSNWMYIKIYCHPTFGDTILLKKIKPLIQQLRFKTEIEKWFFVRYSDSGFHLRFRIFLPISQQGYVLELLNQLMKKELNLGLISKLQLDTYKPEWERYGHDLLSATEACFYQGSEWILYLLQLQHKNKKDNTEIAMLNIHAIFNAAAITNKERESILSDMYHSLQAEHGLDKQDQIELGIKYRNYRDRITAWLYNNSRKHKTQLNFEKSLRRCFSMMAIDPPNLKRRWISDVIHMQLNRTFSDQPRKKEMVIYYLLSKWYLSEEKKSLKMLRAATDMV